MKDKVYTSEKIERPDDIPYAFVPAPIRSIRTFQVGVAAYRQPRELVFRKQAKLLENYEDDYEYYDCRVMLFPTYADMRDIELRGYFTWRTERRSGKRPRGHLTYVLLYIFELINGIGAPDAKSGYEKLIALMEDYGESFPDAFRLYDRWLTHYVIYYRLPEEYLPESRDRELDRNLLILKDSDETDDLTIGMALLRMFTVEENGMTLEFESVTCELDTASELAAMVGRTFKAIKKVHGRHRKLPMMDELFGFFRWRPVKFFSGAIFYDEKKPRTYDYDVSSICKYRCVEGVWKVCEYERTYLKNAEFSDLMRTILDECYRVLSIESEYGGDITTNWIVKEIKNAVASVHEEYELKRKRRVVIDTSKLDVIRQDSIETRDKLLTEAEMGDTEEGAEDIAKDISEDTEKEESSLLTADERELIALLLEGVSLDKLSERGIMISVLCDSINEKLYDMFSDIVIEMDDTPVLIEDYIEDLRELLES